METLALIAHDNRKVDLIAWATYNRDTLARFGLVGTRHTARLAREKVGLRAIGLSRGVEGAPQLVLRPSLAGDRGAEHQEGHRGDPHEGPAT